MAESRHTHYAQAPRPPIPVVNLANTGMVHFTQGNENGALFQPLGGVICTILARYYPNTGKPKIYVFRESGGGFCIFWFCTSMTQKVFKVVVHHILKKLPFYKYLGHLQSLHCGFFCLISPWALWASRSDICI